MSLGNGIDDYVDTVLRNLGDGRVELPTGSARRLLEVGLGISIPQLDGAGFGSSVIDAFRRRYLVNSDFGKTLLSGVSGSPGGMVLPIGSPDSAMPYPTGSSSVDDESFYTAPIDSPASYSDHDSTLALPVATDVWYLLAGDTVIPYVNHDSHQIDENMTRILEDYLIPLLDACLPGVRPLRRPLGVHDIQNGVNNGRYTIKAMRFETWNPTQSQRFPGSPSYFERTGSHVGTNELCAYIAFPIGPLGVMQVLSIVVPHVSEAMRNTGQWSNDSIVHTGGDRGGGWGGLFPHIVHSNDNTCCGLHMVESMYKPCSSHVEYPAPRYFGYDHHPAHQWLRYYLRKDDVWPVPGTPVFMLGKPSPLHCWWYQESSPLAFSGGHFETEHYTSGIVVHTLTVAEAGVGTVGQILLVEVYGQRLYVRASDFYPYKDGDRVALLKRVGCSSFSFHWGQMIDMVAAAASCRDQAAPSDTGYVVYESLLAVPVSFYEEV